MDARVKSRPNHYELLGLTPSATDEEIGQAFAREISPLRPHAFGDIALLSVAHETLRDPAKRRAYDSSLGIGPKPAPKPLQGWQYGTSVRLAVPKQPTPRIEPTTQPPRPNTAPEAPPARDWLPPQPIPQLHIRPLAEDNAEWKRPALIAGGLFASVALIGVLAGLWSAQDVQSKAPAETIEIPAAAEAQPPAHSPPTEVAKPVRNAAPSRNRERQVRASNAARRAQPQETQGQLAEDVPEIPTEQVTALASQPAEAPAAMPLPAATIARTIGRIGYSCGEVASRTAVDGAPGVFKVTCTSGQSYRAAPVRGRYHFRRWGG